MILNICLFVLISNNCISHVRTVEVNRSAEGYPAGFASNCEGHDKPAIIPKKLLKQLFFDVEAKTSKGKYRKRYNYFNAAKGISEDSHVDLKNKRTVVFVSGYLDFSASPVSQTFGDYYLKLDYNVIILDTNRFSTYYYPIAARLSRDVGRRTAMVLRDMATLGLDPKRTELVGLSLGAQTASFIAKNFRTLTGVKFTRITGLDPAGPCFRNLPPDERIDASDADHVDILHTNIDGYGIATPAGHVDFYINGGEFQPTALEELPLCTTVCSHLRAFYIWQKALEFPKSFIGMSCDSVQEARDSKCYDKEPQVTNLLGLKTDFSKPGIYFLVTSNIPPYHRGKEGLKRESAYWRARTRALNVDEIIL